MRRARTLPVLANHGLVTTGTIIEVIPDALPVDATTRDPRLFRARIEKTNGLRESVVWEFDGQSYSLTELSNKLWDEHMVTCLANYTFKHWRVVGQSVTMWDEAERFAR